MNCPNCGKRNDEVDSENLPNADSETTLRKPSEKNYGIRLRHCSHCSHVIVIALDCITGDSWYFKEPTISKSAIASLAKHSFTGAAADLRNS